MENLKKSSIILLVDCEIPFPSSKLDALPHFKESLSKGISNFMLKPSDSHISLLISLLGFSKTFEKPSFFHDKILYKKNEFMRFFEKIDENTEKNNIIEEDTMTEIRYIEKPTKFCEISHRLKGIVLTNNEENAKFCHFIALDYYFLTAFSTINFNDFFNEKLKENYDMIIFDFSFKKEENLNEILTKYNEEVLSSLLDQISYYFMFNRVFSNENSIENIMNSHRNSIDEKNPFKEKILKIVPKQTYEYLNGEINGDFVNKSNIQLFFSYLYEIGNCRNDKITSFEMVGKEENANLIGNKIINSHLFIRELTFRLGKLPKFGA